MSNIKICPYPGLRPFNIEESIYFKGREEHISKIINQLQDRKFLMVTGASGDGKSSLIYAGLIPRAKAGFFKARFNNWIIADLKPERAPIKNLAYALTKHLNLNNHKNVEDELSYGFSSLLKIYKESNYYSEAGNLHSDTNENVGNNSCSNLLILIDQFEELFTNSENFNNGKPSIEAATFINLIIETTILAKEQNLPIYIVCTMRSDYVGDCAAFKGLPEHIVYSQFFVPRLKRQEIHRAIVEPALLSGNKINNRLVEKIINELTDGQDQLPILQHALNRIWRTHIEDDSDEMDLIHFAKVGGMKGEVLPEEQKSIFTAWLANQNDFKRQILHHPSLSNVLNAHARELYNSSYDNYLKLDASELNKEESLDILKKIFTCLTKVNDNRAVRNRVSVKEIKQIINNKEVDNKTISGLIKQFRDFENTLVQPFIIKDTSEFILNDDDVLDITHESLIRNWKELTAWTEKEQENVLILNDFKKQLERWELNSRSKDFLLTIGSLNYFQLWKSNFNLNPYLVVKFDDSAISSEDKIEKSKIFISSANEFLLKSEGAIKQKRRTLIVLTSVVIFILLGFTAWAFMERNKAITQQNFALQKTKEANLSKEEALTAKNFSEKSKEQAILAKEEALKNAEIAQDAKQSAEKSANEALSQKNIALKATSFAQIQAKKAQSEAERANTEAENAKKQTLLAEESRNNAIVSEKKAKELSLASLSQQLAYKSNEKFDEKQLSGILALHAFNYHKEINDNKLDPVIYSGLNSALLELKTESFFSFKNKTLKEQKLIGQLDENNLFSVGNDGIIYFWDIISRKIILEDKTTIAKNGTVNYMVFDKESNMMIVGYDNNIVSFIEITEKKIVKKVLQFDFLKGLLRGCIFDKNKVNLILKNGELFSFDLSDTKNSKSGKIDKVITSFYKYSDDIMLVGTSSGELISINGVEFKTLLNNIPGSITAIKSDIKAGEIFLGTSSGNLLEYDFKNEIPKEINAYKIAKGAITKLDFNDKIKKCVALSADKKITIIDFFNKNSKPAIISTPDLFIRAIMLTKDGKIITSSSDLKIKEYETDMEIMATELCPLLKRNLSETEWNKYVGDNVSYKTLNCIK